MRLRLVLVLLALASGLWAQGARADGRDVYTVATVPVDATAANANAARDEARADGERKAYGILMQRLTLAASQSKIPAPNQSLLDTLISGFEVSGEHTSTVRYLAKLTYHFRADAVRKMLRDANVPFCETPSKPVLILPVLENGGAPVLWEDPNPWRDAWNAHPPRSGLVPLVFPNGDLADVQAIDAPAAQSGDAAKLAAEAQHYSNADVLVADATLDASTPPHAVTVKAKRYTPGSDTPPQSFDARSIAAADEPDADLYAAAIAATASALEDAWKQANMLDLTKSAVLTVTVPTGSLDSFVAMRAALAQVPAITKSEIVSLDRDNAKLAIHYNGSPDQLRTALAQHDLTLGGQDPDWVIQPHQPAPQ